jgi:CheY-like chemotaxis protein
MRQIRQRILCVDDNADIREMLTALLGAEGYDATAVAAQDAARFVARGGFDLFILDRVLRTGAGLELCRELRRRRPHAPVIIYSADASGRHHREAARAGATACVDKPHIEPLVGAVKKLTGRKDFLPQTPSGDVIRHRRPPFIVS